MKASIMDHKIRPRWKHIMPLPNDGLSAAVGSSSVASYYMVGEAYAHLASRHLPDKPRILDIGCGCGRLARFFHIVPTVESYVGFDVILAGIRWCKSAFEHVGDKRFLFVYADIFSDNYNPGGKIKAVDYRFPVADNAVNFVLAASLFTHILEDECQHYLDEVSRTLCKGGMALISIHDEPPAGVTFSGDRNRIDIDRDHFVGMARKRGLVLVDEMNFKQRIFVFRRNS